MEKNTAAAAASKSHKKSKKGKKFLEAKDATLELANIIASGQEDKSNAKISRIHDIKSGNRPDGERKIKSSSSKQKLKETKAALLAKRAQLKREKAKMRMDKVDGSTSAGSSKVAIGPKPDKPVRKRVSFA